MAIAGGLAPAGEPSAFSSLLDGLVGKRDESLLAGLIEEPPLALTSLNASRVSAGAKGKDTRNAENNGSTGKKGEPKPDLVSIPATEAPPQPSITRPILFRTPNWETDSGDDETPPSKAQPDDAASGQPDTAVISTTTVRPLPATSVPSGNEPAPTARIAFGLYLTASNQEADTAAGGSLEFKRNNPALESAKTDLPSPGSPARVTVDANHGAPSNSIPVLNVRKDAEQPMLDLPLPSHRALSPTNVPEPVRSLGSGDGRDDNAQNAKPESETSLWPGVGGARLASGDGITGPQLAPSAGAAKQQDGQGSDTGVKLASVPFSSAAPVSYLSGSSTDPQGEGLQAEEPGKQNVLGNTSLSKPADHNDAIPTPAPAANWIASLRAQQEQRAVDKAGEGGPVSMGPVSNMVGSQTDAKRDPPEPGGHESRGNTNVVETEQAAGGPSTRAGRSAGAPPQPTSTRTVPDGAASPAAAASLTSPATSSPAVPQAPSSQAMPLQGTSVQSVPNPLTLSQAIAPQATPPETTASQTAMTAIEPEVNAAPKPPAATQISLQLTGEGSTKVNVDLSERAGKVQVAVRTADPDLTKSMRTDLGDLVERLESKGFKTEAFVPESSRHTLAAASEQSGSTNSQSSPRHFGSGTGQRQGRQGQNGSNQRQQARWTAQMEETLSTEEMRTTNE
jgi:hypothetical protein